MVDNNREHYRWGWGRGIFSWVSYGTLGLVEERVVSAHHQLRLCYLARESFIFPAHIYYRAAFWLDLFESETAVPSYVRTYANECSGGRVYVTGVVLVPTSALCDPSARNRESG